MQEQSRSIIRKMDKREQSKARKALSSWPMIFGWLAMLIFALYASSHMIGAGDTWVAMAGGRHIIDQGVDTVEPFSANSRRAGPTEEDIQNWPGWAQWITDKVGLKTVQYWHPTGWINQNWLTHVFFYWLSHKSPVADAENFSFNTLVFWKFLIYILTVICVFYMGRLLGANRSLCVVFSCFAMFVARNYLDIRPAGFSNLLAAIFLLVLILATYRNIKFIWLIVPITVFWCNVHGGYLYVFIMLLPFIGLNLLTSFWKGKFVSLGSKGLYHAVLAGFVSFIAMIVLNPFHLTNLTHTFVISIGKHAEMWRQTYEWQPAFKWSNPIGGGVPFLIMCIAALVFLLAWIVVLSVCLKSAKQALKGRDENSEKYRWPKIDLGFMAIVALTIYMALRSRRFIPMAAIAACPLLAMLIDQMIRAICTAYNVRKKNLLKVSSMPKKLRVIFILAGAAATIFFGTWWGLKFKRVYLDPWPNDEKFHSVFMRMTASDVKPFYALEFIKLNELDGKMFNHWTEGGFIAWGQEPDPNTGKIPLQLFMDGRSQAAYEPIAYKQWSSLVAGGDITAKLAQIAKARNRSLETKDIRKIGRWVNRVLKKNKVWIALIPAVEFNKPFVKALEANKNWRPVFLNAEQRLLVDITTAKGKDLYDGMFTGNTVYPDEYSRNLILAHNLFVHFANDKEKRKQAFDAAKRAFELQPSAAPMAEIIVRGARYPEFASDVYTFCKNFVDEFEQEKKVWTKKHGHRERLNAARLACVHLEKASREPKDVELREFYSQKKNEYIAELKDIVKTRKW